MSTVKEVTRKPGDLLERRFRPVVDRNLLPKDEASPEPEQIDNEAKPTKKSTAKVKLRGEESDEHEPPPTKYSPRRHNLDGRAAQVADLLRQLDNRTLLTTSQTATYLGVSKAWLELGRMRNFGPPYRRLSPRQIRYSIDDLTRWLAERGHRSTAEYRDK